MEEYSYTSTHPLGHTGPVTGTLYLFYLYILKNQATSDVVLETQHTIIPDPKIVYAIC